MNDCNSLPAPLIGSPFGFSSTASEVVAGHDLSGTIAIVTGGATGIGIETARALAEAGAHVTIAVRKPDLGEAAVADIASTASGRATWDMLDLANLASVRAFIDRWANRPLNYLVNNAGVMACPQAWTADGFEIQFGTNHLGHFLLAVGLAPALTAGAQQTGWPSRVVAVSSGGHRRSGVDFSDPHFRIRAYERWIAYGQSKTANALFALDYDRRYKDHGIRAFSVAPGSILTPLQRHMSQEELIARGAIDAQGRPGPGLKSPAQGAATSVWAAVGPELDGVGGFYLDDCAQAPPFSETAIRGIHPHAADPEIAARLWEMSVREVAV